MNTNQSDTFLSVTQLNLLASQVLSEQFGLVWLRAEIGSLTRAASGHWYLTLKDADSSVKAVMFRARTQTCEFEPQVGDAVQVQARVGLYEPRGDFQLNVQTLRPDGKGSLHEQFQQLKSKLQAEGLFDATLKRPISAQPRAIGVITSLAAAALHDVLTTLARRAPHVPVFVYPASVQGRDAPLQLRQALAQANARQEVDVILLVRGGGSLEDLWAFNDESLARDVASSEITVICGVGHESDVSIADFAADLRAPTPTAAAELCCMATADLLSRVQLEWNRLQTLMQRRLDRLGQRLDQLTYGLISPSQRLAQQAQILSRLEQRLHKLRPDLGTRVARVQALQVSLGTQMSRQLQRADVQLRLAHMRLQTLAPQATLARGFAIVRTAQGQLVRDASQLAPGQSFDVELARGRVQAEVVAAQKP